MIVFHCEKVLLQGAIATASRAVAAKSPNPALEGLLLHVGDTVTVTGYNLATGIRTTLPATVSKEGEVVLNARLFGDIVRRLPNDEVTVTVDDHLLVHLNCGDADFDISGLDAKDFPELPTVEEEYSVTMARNTLRDMIEQSAFSVSLSESRPVHMGALFEVGGGELSIAAVDGFRLAVRREKLITAVGGAFSFVVPGTALNEVKNICGDNEDGAAISLGKRQILFEIGNTELICRRLEGEFLDYKKVVPRNNPIGLIVDTKELMASIDRVSVVISEANKGPVRCKFMEERVLLSAKTGNGEAKDVCRLQGNGNGLEIGFNNRYLMEALRYAPADTVRLELNSGISPAVIVPVEGEENFLYMILPVRLRTSE